MNKWMFSSLSRSSLASESSAYFEVKTKSIWWLSLILVHSYNVNICSPLRSADSSMETSSLFFLDFFVTSDVCTTGGWVGAVITTPGAIHDGSGGQHSALFTPAPSSAFCSCSTAPDNCQKDTTLEALIFLLRLYCALFLPTFIQTQPTTYVQLADFLETFLCAQLMVESKSFRCLMNLISCWDSQFSTSANHAMPVKQACLCIV